MKLTPKRTTRCCISSSTKQKNNNLLAERRLRLGILGTAERIILARQNSGVTTMKTWAQCVMRKLYNPICKFAFAMFMSAGASLVSFAPAAQADTFLVGIDDSTDSIVIDIFQNGMPFRVVHVGGESITGTRNFMLFNSATLPDNVSFAVNIFEPDQVTLSDTLSITGTTGDTLLTVNFFSDVDGGPPLTPLTGAISVVETDSFIAAGKTLSVSNGDTYTFQFLSSPSEVPLPAALPLFATGLAALGLLGWHRKAAG